MAEDARRAVLLALEYLDGMRGSTDPFSPAQAQALLEHLAKQGFVVRHREGEHLRLREPAMERRRTSGADIRAACVALGLSIKQLAARAGVQQGGLAKIESGQTSPRQATLVMILDALAAARAEGPDRIR